MSSVQDYITQACLSTETENHPHHTPSNQLLLFPDSPEEAPEVFWSSWAALT